eukprot:6213734-Pleurochrysis_carterae.AAC.4
MGGLSASALSTIAVVKSIGSLTVNIPPSPLSALYSSHSCDPGRSGWATPEHFPCTSAARQVSSNFVILPCIDAGSRRRKGACLDRHV